MLDDIGRQYNTDKASHYVNREGVETEAHDLLRHYERELAPRQQDEITVLDLGAGFPPHEYASANMWADYFPCARVVVVDHESLPEPTRDRVHFVKIDLGDAAQVAALAASFEPDLIVEDASHLWSHQLMSLLYLFPRLRSGGVFIMEDIHTSSPSYDGAFGGGSDFSTLDTLMLLCQLVALRDSPNVEREGRSLVGNLTVVTTELLRPRIGSVLGILESIARYVDTVTIVRHAALIRRT